MVFCLPNLSSYAVTPGEPWTFKGVVPDAVRHDKSARSKWALDPGTKWNVYTLVEGLNENRRVTLKADEGNPPYKLHGFCADYDAPIPDEDVLRELEKFPYKPAWFERTLSGNVRLLWFFETPMLVPSAKFLEYFLHEVTEFFPADKLLPAFDKGAWTNCTRYYTNSTDWKEFEGAKPIPTERITGWLVKIGAKFSWIKESGAVEIPFEVLRPELAKKYPRFSEWTGDFALGEQGPSFWIQDSTSPKSAIVRETGLQTFSAHATQGFYSWGDLLGSAFVKDYQADNMGRAVEGIYHDGKHYWRQLDNGLWRNFDKADTKEFLRCSRGVSIKKDKTGICDLDRAMQHIQRQQAVMGAGPFIFRPSGRVILPGNEVVLNISNVRVLTPAGEKAYWGPHGQFPFLSRWSDSYWDPVIQLDFQRAWLKIKYESGFYLKPQSGHNVFIAGPPGIGKGFFSHGIVGRALGGSAEAESLLLGSDSFSSDLFSKPHWYVDDAVFATNARDRRRFTEMIKKLAANSSFRSNEKFKVATNVYWQGCVIVTMNCDEESLMALPELQRSILDKIMIWRTAELLPFKYPKREEMDKILERELPYYLRWLLDWEIPDHVKGDNRFGGIRTYHEASLVTAADQSSNTSAFLEILEDWKEKYFSVSRQEFWEGTAFQLYVELSEGSHFGAMKKFDLGSVARQLSALKNKGHGLECIDTEGTSRRWRIYRENRFEPISSAS